MEQSAENNFNRIPPKYEFLPDEIDELTAELLSERASEIPEEIRYITIEVDGNDNKYANIGRHIEREVFEESFGNDSEEMIREYGPYEPASVFFISFDRELSKATGALRAIGNSSRGLKTLNDAQSEPFNVSIDEAVQYHNIDNLDEVWDIGTAAVLPEYRASRSMPSIQLYRTMYLSALKNNINHLVSIVDDKLLNTLVDRLAMPFVHLADSTSGEYLGSEKSHAVYAYVPEFYDKMSAAMSSVTSHLGKNILSRLVNGSEDDSIILI
jgi:hypothetical protein